MRELAAEFRARRTISAARAMEPLQVPAAHADLAGTARPAAGCPTDAPFAFVLGTDPEVFLFHSRARPRKPTPSEWQYAFAPMTIFAGRVQGIPPRAELAKAPQSIPGRAFFDRTDRAADVDEPSKPFFSKAYEP